MAVPNSRTTLIEYCKRKLGDPVLEITVDDFQIEDRIDEAIQYWQEYHYDATRRTFLKHQITATDKANEYISIPTNILFINKMFPVSSSFGTSFNFFDIKYQMMLNDIADMQNFAGDLAYYEQMQQFLSLLDMKLNGQPQIQWSRHENRLYIHGDFADDDIDVDDFIILDVYQIVDTTSATSVFNDWWLKEYATQLIKQQWGMNLIKFEGVQLPGGVTFNGRQLYDDATAEIERLKERLHEDFSFAAPLMVG